MQSIISGLDESVFLSVCENIVTVALLEYCYVFTSSYGSSRFCVHFPNEFFYLIFNPAVLYPCKLNTTTMYLYYVLRNNYSLLSLFLPTLSVQNTINPTSEDHRGMGTRQHHTTETASSSTDKDAHLL